MLGTLLVFVIWSAGLLALAWLIFHYVRHEYDQNGRLSSRGTFLEILIFGLHGLGMNIPYLGKSIPPFTNQRGLILAAIFLALTGLAIVAASMGGLGWRRTAGHVVGLKQDGLYRYSRNPQIVGYGLVVLSIPFFYASWWLAAWALLYLPIAHWMVLAEEDHLRRTVGAEFIAYCQQTPRYIGIYLQSKPA